MADILTNLYRLREDLLREYMLARGMEKATVLTRIMEVEEEIKDENERQKVSV